VGFPASSLVASGGELWSHVFENPSQGIARDHFWTMSLELDPSMTVSLETEITYRGLIVSKQNVTPSPASVRDASLIAGSLVDLDAYRAIQEDGHRFILPPRP
jgi:hypothetical protein